MYGGALIGPEERKTIMKVVDSNYWPLAEEGKNLELEASNYIGTEHAILTNSGSSAGLIALAALELSKGSEVVIPATTFPTIFNIILQCGLVPVVVDCDPKTNNIDVTKLEQAIGENTKAIIAVHAVGNPCDMEKIMEIANRHNLIVLEDFCDCFGGGINGKKHGAIGHIGFTSFHAAHIVAMGQGGGVFTSNPTFARNARMYRDWGRQADLSSRTNDKWPNLPRDYDSRFIYEKIGYNLSPLELQAAMGRVQLKKTNKIKELRQANYAYFVEHLAKFPRLKIAPAGAENADVCWFALPLSVETDERGRLTNFLEENGIETRSLFAGNILKHPAYENVPHRVGNDLSGSNWILEHSFWIGVHPRMTEADRKYVVRVFAKYFKLYP